MTPDQCLDKLQFTLSDESGVLRFKSFDIADAPECWQIAKTLRQYLVGRALDDVDVDYIRSLSCSGSGVCIEKIATVVAEYREMWADMKAS